MKESAPLGGRTPDAPPKSANGCTNMYNLVYTHICYQDKCHLEKSLMLLYGIQQRLCSSFKATFFYLPDYEPMSHNKNFICKCVTFPLTHNVCFLPKIPVFEIPVFFRSAGNVFQQIKKCGLILPYDITFCYSTNIKH